MIPSNVHPAFPSPVAVGAWPCSALPAGRNVPTTLRKIEREDWTRCLEIRRVFFTDSRVSLAWGTIKNSMVLTRCDGSIPGSQNQAFSYIPSVRSESRRTCLSPKRKLSTGVLAHSRAASKAPGDRYKPVDGQHERGAVVNLHVPTGRVPVRRAGETLATEPLFLPVFPWEIPGLTRAGRTGCPFRNFLNCSRLRHN
jgi:hypothetical protein